MSEYQLATAEELRAMGRAVDEVLSGRINCRTVTAPGGRIATIVRTVDMKNIDELEQVAGLRRPKLTIVK